MLSNRPWDRVPWEAFESEVAENLPEFNADAERLYRNLKGLGFWFVVSM